MNELQSAAGSDLTIGITGLELLLEDIVNSSSGSSLSLIAISICHLHRIITFFDIEDLMRTDTISLPLALLLICLLVGNFILVLVPILVLVTSLVTSFAIMYLVETYSSFSVSSLSPPIMMSLTVALSIDYSLFFLMR